MFNFFAAILFAFATYGWTRATLFDSCLKVGFLIATIWAVFLIGIDMGYIVRV